MYFICVYTCDMVYASVCMCIHLYMYVPIERLMLQVFTTSYNFFLLFCFILRQDLSLNFQFRLYWLTSKSLGSTFLQIHPPLVLELQYTLELLAFMWVMESEFSSSWLHVKHFEHLAETYFQLKSHHHLNQNICDYMQNNPMIKQNNFPSQGDIMRILRPSPEFQPLPPGFPHIILSQLYVVSEGDGL